MLVLFQWSLKSGIGGHPRRTNTFTHGLFFVYVFPQLPITKVLIVAFMSRCLFKAVSWGSDVCILICNSLSVSVFPNPSAFPEKIAAWELIFS